MQHHIAFQQNSEYHHLHQVRQVLHLSECIERYRISREVSMPVAPL